MTNQDKQKASYVKGSKTAQDQINGSMVNSVEEMIKLGKEMQEMRTNKELLAEGQLADPQQETSPLVNRGLRKKQK